MKIVSVFLLSASVASAHKLRARHQSMGVFDDDASGPTPYAYLPTNINTKAPTAFTDEVLPDERYHELVPALQVLQELTTTPAPANSPPV